MSRPTRAAALFVVAVLIGALSTACTQNTTSAASTSAATAPATTPAAAPATAPATALTTSSSPATAQSTRGGSYLALGDSLAAGLQPTTGDQPKRGYVGPVLADLIRHDPGIALTNFGCSGETTTSMIRGGRCTYPQGNQLAAAVAFLRTNAAATQLVTLDMGANNVLGCARPVVDQACAVSGTATVARELAAILGQLRAAAPQVEIVVLTYYNPLLAAWHQGAEGRQLATSSQPLLGGLNATITGAAAAVGAKVADVAGAFASTELTTAGPGDPPAVQRICAWTWMCTRGDIHANDQGYAAMAKAVIAVR